MNRRKFLKLAAGVLAGLGLKPGKKTGTSDVPETTVTSGYVDTGELEVHRWQTTFDGGIPYTCHVGLEGYEPEILCASHGDCPECPSLEGCPQQFKSYRPLLIEYFASNPVSYTIQFEAEA